MINPFSPELYGQEMNEETRKQVNDAFRELMCPKHMSQFKKTCRMSDECEGSKNNVSKEKAAEYCMSLCGGK